MSRPKLTPSNGANFKIEVPPGWFTTISIVSRRSYNQLVTVDYDISGIAQSSFIGNTFGRLNEVMKDIDTTNDLLAIVPQGDPQTLVFSVYYSTQGSIKGERLKDDKYKSNRANIITNNKPPRAPKDFPDYSTYLIFVEDGPPGSQVAGTPEYDDSLITVNIIQGFKQASPPVDTSSQVLTQTGKDAILEFINQYTDPAAPGPTIPIPPGPLPGPVRPPLTPELKALPVAILGAGVSGLYIAMMLDSLDIKYELLEGSDRTGGRLLTHYFQNKPGKYQYCDIGAMRFPDTSFMQRTFDLARNRLGIKDKMLSYVRNNEKCKMNFNGITKTKKEYKDSQDARPRQDLFKFSKTNDGNIPDNYVAQGSNAFWDDILGELRQLFVDYPFDVAFQKFKEVDGHSVTSYLTLVKNIPFEVSKWYETMESRTGLADTSLAETVLGSLVFIDPRFKDKTVNWYCFDGGTEILHKAMEAKIKSKPQHNYRAIIIKETDNGQSVTVTFDRSGGPRQLAVPQVEKKYSNVISTMSMACLRMVDLDKIYLSNGQRAALRELAYTPSIKVALQFKTPWWETKCDIVGGQSETDRPIRAAVYPSYGPDDSHPGFENFKKTNCMLGSYNGLQDAQRLAGLMKGRGTPEEKVLLDLVMRDLAALHDVPVDDIWNEYEDYFPYDWYANQFQLGAFAGFGPGQFRYTYPYLTQPASKDQRFHFAGDATSTFHGWVAGGLNSGWRAVLGLLQTHPELNPYPNEDIIAKFKQIWGPSEEWDDKDLATHNWLARELTKRDLATRASARSANLY